MQNIHPNNITELVFILDRSGSMAGLEDDTITASTRTMRWITVPTAVAHGFCMKRSIKRWRKCGVVALFPPNGEKK